MHSLSFVLIVSAHEDLLDTHTKDDTLRTPSSLVPSRAIAILDSLLVNGGLSKDL